MAAAQGFSYVVLDKGPFGDDNVEEVKGLSSKKVARWLRDVHTTWNLSVGFQRADKRIKVKYVMAPAYEYRKFGEYTEAQLIAMLPQYIMRDFERIRNTLVEKGLIEK